METTLELSGSRATVVYFIPVRITRRFSVAEAHPGPARMVGQACRLLYLLYDAPGPVGVKHGSELSEFIALTHRDRRRDQASAYSSGWCVRSAPQIERTSTHMIERYL